MQPYFLPYIGYFQLIEAVDLFIVYDNIKYTKKGWIARNRMLRDGKPSVFSLALKSASHALDVRERELAAEFDGGTLLNRLREAYRRAPYFAQAFPVIESVVLHGDRNLFGFLDHSIRTICEALGIATELRKSSEIPIDPALRHQDRVIALCRAVGASVYVNASGGTELYSSADFHAAGIELKFINPAPFQYPQFGNAFVPWLSIVDVMMFNPAAAIRERLASGYALG